MISSDVERGAPVPSRYPLRLSLFAIVHRHGAIKCRVELNPVGQQTHFLISDWEGLVQQFEPTAGRVIWSKDYGLGLYQTLRLGPINPFRSYGVPR